MSDSKLLKLVNASTKLGRWLNKWGRNLCVLSLIPFAVALIADQIHWRRESADYADVDDAD